MGGGGGFRRLLTDRLDLRSVAIGDQQDLHRILSDPSNLTYIPAEPLQSSGATQAWIERYMSRWDVNGLSYWTIRLRSSGAVIGAGGAERRQEFWNLYYLLDVGQRGRGYGTELARAAQRAAAALDPDLPLVAWIHEKNIASQAVARHLGLRDFGLLETDHWKGAPMHYWADREPVLPTDLPASGLTGLSARRGPAAPTRRGSVGGPAPPGSWPRRVTAQVSGQAVTHSYLAFSAGTDRYYACRQKPGSSADSLRPVGRRYRSRK